MFEIGSYVAYRSEGVCVITDIREENFGTSSESEQYYILTPVHHTQSTLFVPVKNRNLTALMRVLMSADEINEMATELRDQRLDLPAECRVRNNVFKEIISRGDRRELAVLVLTLAEKAETTLASGKKVGSTEAGALRRAENMLYEEFAVTTNIRSTNDVLAFLRGNVTLDPKT